jgi:hypothetical protein
LDRDKVRRADMRSGAAERGRTGGSISLPDQKASHPVPDYETEQILIVCWDEVARIIRAMRASFSRFAKPSRMNVIVSQDSASDDSTRTRNAASESGSPTAAEVLLHKRTIDVSARMELSEEGLEADVALHLVLGLRRSQNCLLVALSRAGRVCLAALR